MSTIALPTKKNWIQSPRFDYVYFSYGWVNVFLAFLAFKNYSDLLIIVFLLFNFVHRHYTFALVYGLKDELKKRKRSYILMPVVFALIEPFLHGIEETVDLQRSVLNRSRERLLFWH